MRTWVTVTIVIISLIVVGIVIWICMRKGRDNFVKNINNTEEAIKKYMNLPPSCSRRTVVALTATEDEMSALERTILSLVKQTCRVNQFALTILMDREVVLPPTINKFVNLFKAGRYYGKVGTAIIPTLLRENDANTIIIFVKPGDTFKTSFVHEITERFLDNPFSGPVNLHGATLVTTGMLSADILTDVLEDQENLQDYATYYKSTTDVAT